MNAKARAKINLALHVTGQRDDGYHLLDSLVCFSQLGDELSLEPAIGNAGEVQLLYKGNFAHALGHKSDNLVIKAATLLAKQLAKMKVACENATITLEKNLPVASGLGGGSADAAAVLNMLKKFWAPAHDIDLELIARNLGADVPMCLNPLPKRVRGIGEKMQPFALPLSLPLILVNPGINVSTPQIFKELKNRHQPPITMAENPQFATPQDVARFLFNLRNGLEAPAISKVPQIANILSAIDSKSGCLLARMSGSGATCFGIFATQSEAQQAALDIALQHPKWWSVATTTYSAKENDNVG